MKKGIIATVSVLAGAAFGAVMIGKKERKLKAAAEEKTNRYIALFHMMDQWVQVKQEGKNLASYFEKEGYKRIAVYGMGCAGKTLVSELEGSGVEVAYGIDRRADAIYADIDVFSVDDPLEEVDAVVVTAITFFDEIEEKLSEKMDCPIISLEEILCI